MQVIQVKIDVTKINKDRLFKGKQGTYLDAVIFVSDKPDQYCNDGMIVQSVSKEEREQGVRGEIIGNIKLSKKKEEPKQQTAQVSISQHQPADDLPF